MQLVMSLHQVKFGESEEKSESLTVTTYHDCKKASIDTVTGGSGNGAFFIIHCISRKNIVTFSLNKETSGLANITSIFSKLYAVAF